MTSTAIITGGSRGLGKALAEHLVSDGWQVIIDGRHEEEVRSAGAGGARAIPGDVTHAAHRRDLVEAARETGRLDLLVNNASSLGASPLPRLADLTFETLEDLYWTNVFAPLALIQESLSLLKESRGAVINVTSDAAREPYEGWGGYGSSKAALEQVSNILAVEQPDLSVWWFDPGDMRTRMHQEAFPGEDISDRPPPESVVPALAVLLAERPPSGRIQASDLLVPGRS
jgi:NAD(P)-dependent dehydrogenase (short-subunit alcohol dehydrogenase family)